MTKLSYIVALVAAVASTAMMCDTKEPPQTPTEPGGTGGAPVVDAGSTGGAAPATGGAAGAVEARCQFREIRASAIRGLTGGRNPRVINGEDADLAQYPGLCSLQTPWGSHYCACTVLTPRWVLTAGHCQPALGDHISAGCADLRTNECQQRRVVQGLEHEQYTDWSEGHDFALARVDEPFLGVMPIPLSAVAVAGRAATVVGWGRTCTTCPTSPILQEAELSLLSQHACEVAYPGSITDSMVCAAAFGRDAAPGDSGGFLGQEIGGELVQVGVVSWGRQCKAGDPGEDPKQTCVGVYARLDGEVPGIQACVEADP